MKRNMLMNLWHDLEPGPSVPDVIHTIVEIPKGSRNKFEDHKPTGAFKLDRVLYSPVHYPGDYGFIPQTYYEDGDPLDVLVVTNLPTFTGCIVEARPIGMFKMRDKGESDDKILAVLHYDPFFDGITTTLICQRITLKRSSISSPSIKISRAHASSRSA